MNFPLSVPPKVLELPSRIASLRGPRNENERRDGFREFLRASQFPVRLYPRC
jgi:hypothetical protein